MTASKRIGIFAGTFDPVHDGHVAFALAAMQQCDVDEVIFLPERSPRGKHDVTSLAHRVAMLRAAITNQPRLSVMELPDDQFSVAATLPELQQRLPGVRLSLLVGTDVARNLHSWPDAGVLLASVDVIVAVREGDEAPNGFTVVDVSHPHVAASKVRGGESDDIPPAVRTYITRHNLYRV